MTVLNVINGVDGDVPLPEAWGDAYKANHSEHFYSSVDADAAIAQYTVWRNLVAAEAALVAQGLGADAANRTDQIPAIMNSINSVTCDGGKTIACAGTTPSVTVGTLTQYEPPPLPDGAWIYLPDSTMWILATNSDGINAGYDTEANFVRYASDVNGDMTNNPSPSVDATTGADITVTLDGWGVPSKADVNALMGTHGGSTTPGQWLDGQTGQVAHALLGQWNGNEIWTSDAGCIGVSGGGFDSGCKAIAQGFITFELDTALFTNEVRAADEYALLVRTLDSGEVWTPKNW
jgi:hypothetical protein